jgi:hypothetical protein
MTVSGFVNRNRIYERNVNIIGGGPRATGAAGAAAAAAAANLGRARQEAF